MRTVFAAFVFGSMLFAPRHGHAQQAQPRRIPNAAGPEALIARLMTLDVDGDGKLSKEEVSDPRMQPIVARADADGDGLVTRQELEAMAAAPRGPGAGRPNGQGPGGGPADFGMPPGGPPQIGQVLPEFVQEMLGLNERQKKRLAALQKEVDTRLANILTEEQKQKIAELQSRPPSGPDGAGGFGPPDGQPGTAPPRGPRKRAAGDNQQQPQSSDDDTTQSAPE